MESDKTKFQKSYFDVLGICCSSEVPLIENILKSLNGVKEFSVIVPSRTVIVVHDSLLVSPSQIVKALNQARLEANVKVNGKTNFKNKWPSPFAVVSGVLLLLSFLKYVYPPLRWLAVAAVAAGIYPILAKTIASIRRLRVDINILIIITVAATLAMQDYMEAAAVVFLFTIAEWLETRASYKATSVMQSLMSLSPQKAIIAETGEEVEVDEVKINTVLAVKAGETIAIDGIVENGNCEVDEKTLTGEAFPVPKQKDSIVWAGTINLNGYISVKTTALASDCVVTKMAKLVEEAQSSKTKSQRLIDKCSQYYTPAIILISASFAIIPSIMKVKNLNHWFHLALVVLVSACPCGLILSTPVATFCALTKAATSGLLIKTADSLDTLSKIKIAGFDKTGTITRGEFIVIDFKSLSKDITLKSLLYWVASVESKSSHPMAATIVDYARSESVEPRPEMVEDYRNFPGEGIFGKIDGNDLYIGNKRIVSRAGCSTVPDIEVDTKGGKTVGYIYVGEKLAGVFNLSDTCRSGVAQAMTELKDLGIKTAMLTGDNQDSAMYAQEQLGNALDIVHGELLPEDKSKIIQEFKKDGATAMVGDGVNDAPALATADIGISMGISGSALATETGHIILMSNDIRRIPQAIKLARRTRRKVVENLVISISLKVGVLILAFAGHPLIWVAVLVDVGTCLIVIMNSMLLLRDKDKKKNKKCYRSSVVKLEGGEEEDLDLEAGLLVKRGECKLGCCGDKKKMENVVVVKHSQSGCCSEKSRKHEGDLAILSSCKKSSYVNNGGSSCCSEKSKKPEGDLDTLSSCKKFSHVNNGGSSCCGKKKEKLNEIVVAKSCCEDEKTVEMQIFGLEKVVQTKIDETCKSRCCGTKEKVKETGLEKVVQTKIDETCKSRCCGNKDKVKETGLEKVVQTKNDETCKSRCCGNKDRVQETGLEKVVQTKIDETCKSRCCGTKDKVKETGLNEIVAKSSCEEEKQVEKTVEMQTKIDETCKSSCCGNQEKVKETGLNEIVAKICCEEEKQEEKTVEITGLEKVVKTKIDETCCGNKEKAKETGLSGCGDGERQVGEATIVDYKGQCHSVCFSDEITLASEEETRTLDYSSGCCGDKEEVRQICHEKTGLDIESCGETEVREQSDIEKEGQCKSGCCGDEKQSEITLASEEETDNSDCLSRCCKNKDELKQICHKKAVNLEEIVKVCCTDLEVKKIESCCKVKIQEACGVKCREKEKLHIGKSCCRSYAKKYCSHGHHGHHHHVGAA